MLFWAGAIFALALLHLAPLPPVLWKSLSGLQVVVDVEKLLGLGDRFIPLTIAPMNGWHSVFSLFTPLAVVLLGLQLNRNDLFRVLPLLIAIAGLSGLFGISQTMGDPQGVLYFYLITHKGSAVGLFANRNHAATLLACLFPMLAVYASMARGKADGIRMGHLIAATTAIVLVPLILVTGSRSGLIAGAIGLLAASVLYSPPRNLAETRRGTTRRFKALPILSGLCVIGLAYLTYFLSRAEAIERFQLFAVSSPADSRAEFLIVSLDLFRSYFPWGSGSGSFVEAYQIAEPNRLIDATYLNRAHNDWVETAVTFGLPGVFALTLAVIGFGIHSFRLWRSENEGKRSVIFGRLASVIIALIAVASVSDYPLRTPIMMGVFAICGLWLTDSGRERSATAGSIKEV